MAADDYCLRCDMRNCEHVTGAGKRYDASLRSAPPPRDGGSIGTGAGPTIAARFSGHCKGCGRPYDAGDAITHSRDHDGWVAECCA